MKVARTVREEGIGGNPGARLSYINQFFANVIYEIFTIAKFTYNIANFIFIASRCDVPVGVIVESIVGSMGLIVKLQAFHNRKNGGELAV